MKPTKLYPPGGGSFIVLRNPDKVEEMQGKGWTLEPPAAKKKSKSKTESEAK